MKAAVVLPKKKESSRRKRKKKDQKKIKKIFSALSQEDKDKLLEELLIRANLIKETEDEED